MKLPVVAFRDKSDQFTKAVSIGDPAAKGRLDVFSHCRCERF